MIRWLGADDLAQWRDLRAEALRLNPTAFLTTLEEFLAKSDASVQAQLSRGATLGGFLGDELMCACAYIRKTAYRQTEHRAEVAAVYARPAARGSGIATELMSYLEQHARAQGVTQLELDVESLNTAAIRFYEKLGYTQYGVLPSGTLTDGIARDDLLMVRLLDR